MTNAGWYPDPAGAPDTYRYWDGQSWSQMTTTQPPSGSAAEPAQPAQPAQPGPPPSAPTQLPPGGYGAVPPGSQPQPGQYGGGQYGGGQYGGGQYGGGQYGGGQGSQGGYGGGYGQPQWNQGPQGGSGGGSGKTIGIVIAGVLALVLLGVAGFFGVRALTGDDDGDKKADDPTSDTSESGSTGSTESPTDGGSSTVVPTGIQCTGGTADPEEDPAPDAPTLSGGGLTIPHRDGYTLATGGDVAFSFPDAFVLQYVEVEEYWISLTGVGGLAKANGFDDVADAAEVITQCLTSNDKIYSGFTERTDLTNEAITVDGQPAHRITAEIRVSDPRVTVEGDVTDVIVVDTGDSDSYGLYIGMAAIGDDDLIKVNEDTIPSITVD